ncbi:MAG TPA: hypothetical protein VK671_02620 [Mucilaginibacter sp.]|jgi:hypothetical protein|nr:hypothetical protein [Mucilaginibacter sp.]
MKKFCLLILLLASCKHPKKVSNSFYYWKTVYQNSAIQSNYLQHAHISRLYVRIMDVDFTQGDIPAPVSPIVFKDHLPDTIKIVPVVFIVNNILKQMDTAQLKGLAGNIVPYVDTKIKQAGKKNYDELQIDCDWTATTRDNYFYLLRQLAKKTSVRHQTLSTTLRLHQLKNQKASGIPPVQRVMLMCYNMGNLRKYGDQNSILELSELKKYLWQNLSDYPIPIDVGLPLFSWAVAFRNKQYIGISKKLNLALLTNKNQFKFIGNNLYKAVIDLPEYGLLDGDEVRWESVSEKNLKLTAAYISPFIKADSLNIIYFHLDNDLINTYTYADLEKTTALFR